MPPEQNRSHRLLFQEYLSEMREARRAADGWWRDVLAREASVGPAEEAEQRVRHRWPFGPGSHPFVLAAYRKYYIACLDLNREIEAGIETRNDRRAPWEAAEEDWGTDTAPEVEQARPVPPSVFMSDWLFGKDDDLRLFLADMVLSPIGREDMLR